MTAMTDTLIARLEAATEGSRELDAEIAKAVDAPRQFFESKGVNFEPEAGHVDGPECFEDGATWGGGGYSFEAPPYITSLDAAVSLIPGNVISWSVGDSPGGPTAWLFDGETEYHGFPRPGKGTPALAICIASLRARGGE